MSEHKESVERIYPAEYIDMLLDDPLYFVPVTVQVELIELQGLIQKIIVAFNGGGTGTIKIPPDLRDFSRKYGLKRSRGTPRNIVVRDPDNLLRTFPSIPEEALARERAREEADSLEPDEAGEEEQEGGPVTITEQIEFVINVARILLTYIPRLEMGEGPIMAGHTAGVYLEKLNDVYVDMGNLVTLLRNPKMVHLMTLENQVKFTDVLTDMHAYMNTTRREYEVDRHYTQIRRETYPPFNDYPSSDDYQNYNVEALAKSHFGDGWWDDRNHVALHIFGAMEAAYGWDSLYDIPDLCAHVRTTVVQLGRYYRRRAVDRDRTFLHTLDHLRVAVKVHNAIEVLIGCGHGEAMIIDDIPMVIDPARNMYPDSILGL